MIDPTIASLTTAMAAGDAAAIEAFYRRYSAAMLGMAQSAVPSRRRDEAFCLDVLHDAVLRVVRCVRRMESEAHMLHWTRLVVQSCALDRLRAERRRIQREHRRATLVPSLTPASDASELDEHVAWLTAQLATLDPTVARMFRLRFAEGWTLARIAASLRTTTGQVDGQLRRAIARLRASARTAFGE